MPSPFPGMNPYLEHPILWPEVHHLLITLIFEGLVPQVRPKYRVAIEKRVYEISNTAGENALLVGVPDVSVQKQPHDPNSTNVAVAAPSTQPISVKVPVPEKIQQAYLEIRDLTTGQVITTIEILSPVNKRSGEGRAAYLKKRQKILGSLTNFVEIDLLRGWQPMPILDNPVSSDYRILVSDSNRRPKADLYALDLRSPLPTFSLPLRATDPEPVIELQMLLDTVYDRAGYDYTLDYTQEIVPALSEEDTAWIKEILKQQQAQS